MPDPLTAEEVMRRLSSDNPKARQHREDRADGWSSWQCVPIRDVVEVRAEVLATLDAARQPVAETTLRLEREATIEALRQIDRTLERLLTNPKDGHIPIWAREDRRTIAIILENREWALSRAALATREPEPAPLDAAWAAAEAALPDGWRLWVLDWDSVNATGGWRVVAGQDGDAAGPNDPFVAFGTGPTPAAALHALAARLAHSKDEP